MVIRGILKCIREESYLLQQIWTVYLAEFVRFVAEKTSANVTILLKISAKQAVSVPATLLRENCRIKYVHISHKAFVRLCRAARS